MNMELPSPGVCGHKKVQYEFSMLFQWSVESRISTSHFHSKLVTISYLWQSSCQWSWVVRNLAAVWHTQGVHDCTPRVVGSILHYPSCWHWFLEKKRSDNMSVVPYIQHDHCLMPHAAEFVLYYFFFPLKYTRWLEVTPFNQPLTHKNQQPIGLVYRAEAG